MTFYEAALRVLESAARPLHVTEITQQSISQNLLSHVGKMPEQTMLSRLAAMARRNRDRKLMVTALDTFALVDWGLAEDAAALAVTGVPVPNPEEDLPPYRPPERHPEPRSENARASGRGEKRRRREDEEEERRGGKRRYPPAPEVCFEILSEQNGLRAAEVLERARAKELASEQYGENQLLTALAEDNQRRIDSGRRAQFVLARETGLLTYEAADAASPTPAADIQAVFAEVLGLPFENGRIALRGHAPAVAAAVAPPSAEVAEDLTVVQALRQAGRDSRRAMARVLRRRLAELEAFAFEKACVKMLHAFHFRDLKVAKRNPHGPLLTARKREGSVEFRYAIRMVRGNGALDRKAVQDLRRDLGNYGAQIGLLLTPGDVRGDARSECQSQGALAMIWGGDALADKFLEAKTGVTVQLVELFEVDERFFETVKHEGDEAAHRREVRARERDGESSGKPEGAAVPAAASEAATASTEDAPEQAGRVPAAAAEPEVTEPSARALPAGADEDEGDDGDEGDEADGAESPAQAGAPGEGEPRRKRRRRRRGRRGRGQRPDGTPGAPGEAGAPPAQAGEPPAAASPAESPVPAPASPPPPSGDAG